MESNPVYEHLGIEPLINAFGTMTHIGGSLMAPEVTAAMAEASRSFVPLRQLQERVGERLAELTGAEAAFISAGAASGVMLAGAACLTGTDAEAVARLPDVGTRPSEFVISLVDDHTYIHQSLRLIGGTLAEVGTTDTVSVDNYAAAINAYTAALVVFLGEQSRTQLGEVIELAHAHDLPVIVDAAAQLPPRANLVEIPAMGADLVVFSGGKAIAGPQSTGLVLGRRELVEACVLNSSPNFGAGRGMKVGKEEMVGLLRAVELMLADDEEARVRDWEEQCRQMMRAVGDAPGVTVDFNPPYSASYPAAAPFLRLCFGVNAPLPAAAAAEALERGSPPIVVGLAGDALTVCPQTLKSGEAAVVGRRLADLLNP